jgi:hypothetical protein
VTREGEAAEGSRRDACRPTRPVGALWLVVKRPPIHVSTSRTRLPRRLSRSRVFHRRGAGGSGRERTPDGSGWLLGHRRCYRRYRIMDTVRAVQSSSDGTPDAVDLSALRGSSVYVFGDQVWTMTMTENLELRSIPYLITVNANC